MLRLVRKIKGERRIVLISDACVFDGPVPPGYDGADDINFDFEGEIAGSKLTLDVACRNMMVHTGCSIVDVFRYASSNPAEALRLRAKGELRVGNDADCVIVDNWMNVASVILKGEIVS
jgi:N-acetylglucosamine-6-phosphate deacetylase